MTLKEKRLAAIAAAQDLISKAQAAGRTLTNEERATLAAKNAEVLDLTSRIDQSTADAELMAKFDGLVRDGGSSGPARALSFKGVADRILQTADGEPVGIKALLAGGSQAVETDDIGLTVIKERP